MSEAVSGAWGLMGLGVYFLSFPQCVLVRWMGYLTKTEDMFG